MARIRTIKPDFWTDEKVVELTPWARLLFLGLLNFCDDTGRMVYSEKRIKMQVFPADSMSIQETLRELRERGFILVYAVNSIEYLQIKNFSRHQKINHPSAPTCPPPPGQEDSGSPPLRNGKEGNGKEKEKEQRHGEPAARAPDPIWDTTLEVCGLAGAEPTPDERGKWNKAVKQLKTVKATPAEIRARAAAYRRRWPKIELTPNALATNWNQCVAGNGT